MPILHYYVSYERNCVMDDAQTHTVCGIPDALADGGEDAMMPITRNDVHRLRYYPSHTVCVVCLSAYNTHTDLPRRDP